MYRLLAAIFIVSQSFKKHVAVIEVLYDHQIFSMQKYGGISRYFANLHGEFAKRQDIQARIGILESHNHYVEVNKKTFSRFIQHSFHSRKPLYIENENYCLNLIRKNKFDVFHPTYYNPYFLAELKKPFVLTVHDLIHEIFPQYYTKEDLRDVERKRLLLEKASHVIAISESTKHDVQRFYEVPDNKITVIYHGYKKLITHFKNQKFNPPFDNYILFVGERIRYKNFERLLNVFCKISKQESSLHLVCAGGGAFTQEEMKLFEEYKIGKKVVQISADETALFQLYKHAAVFVFPSLYEGFGLPLLEAFANDCPVAVSNTSCFKEVGADAVLYFDPYNEQEMHDSIQGVLNSKELRKELKAKGQKRLQYFTMEKCADATLRVYQSVVKA